MTLAGSGSVAATININAKADAKRATGLVYGQVNSGFSAVTGTLKFVSWDVLKKEKNIISVTANESTLSIVFSNTIGVIATYEGKGAGNIASGLSGWVEWTNTQ